MAASCTARGFPLCIGSLAVCPPRGWLAFTCAGALLPRFLPLCTLCSRSAFSGPPLWTAGALWFGIVLAFPCCAVRWLCHAVARYPTCCSMVSGRVGRGAGQAWVHYVLTTFLQGLFRYCAHPFFTDPRNSRPKRRIPRNPAPSAPAACAQKGFDSHFPHRISCFIPGGGRPISFCGGGPVWVCCFILFMLCKILELLANAALTSVP